MFVGVTEASLMRYVGLSAMDERTGSDDYSSHTARPGKRSNDTAKRAKRRSHHSQSPSHYVMQTNQRESPPREPASIYHVSLLCCHFHSTAQIAVKDNISFLHQIKQIRD